MKMKLLSLCLGLFTYSLFGQSNWCGFDTYHQSAIDSNPSINWEHQQFIQQLEKFRRDYHLAPKYNSVQSRAACPKRRRISTRWPQGHGSSAIPNRDLRYSLHNEIKEADAKDAASASFIFKISFSDYCG
jgi:hypothetical protein